MINKNGILRLRKSIKFLASKILYPFRNNFVLFDIFRIAQKNEVVLDYWNRSDNLGDAISPIIVEYMLKLKGIEHDKKISSRKHLYAVGSVLTAGIQDCCVWGSGIHNVECCYRLLNRKLDIRAVRGPITRLALIDYGYVVPKFFGDPAILLKEIYNPDIDKKMKYGIIFHGSQKYDGKKYDNSIIIDIKTRDFKSFVKQLKSVETVISSSLHGIILAETYGIKAILLKPEKDLTKYYDWYYSTKRYDFPIASSVEDAMMMEAIELPQLDEMIQVLKNAFPYDLYENAI